MSRLEKEKKRDDSFYPFTINKPLPQLKIGRFSLQERWKKLMRFCNQQNLTVPIGYLPTPKLLDYVKKNRKLPVNLKSYCKVLTNAADLVKNIDSFIAFDTEFLQKNSIPVPACVFTQNKKNIFLETGTAIGFCFINAEAGPVYISKNVAIQEGVCLRGPVYIGENSIIKMGATIYGNTVIGRNCIIGGEIKNSVVMDYSNKAHFGYLGDSIIGEWCNLGAGTSNSNLKNNAGAISLTLNKQNIQAGNKFGVLLGDHCKTAIHTAMNTGTVAGISCNIFAEGLTPKIIPSFSWGVQGEKYIFEKAIKDLEKWMALKGEKLNRARRKELKKIFEEFTHRNTEAQ
jgi:UDP-N-acetylglucosamine diphosphorylase/glucosamine-1-phosphate N-acetyltransferase